MRAIQMGNRITFCQDKVELLQRLEARVYVVRKEMQTGLYLQELEEACYKGELFGEHREKVGKVMDTFGSMNRNMGILLSGISGMGKTTFAKVLMARGRELGYPVILVEGYDVGLVEFLQEIDQKVIVVFDEFEKLCFQDCHSGMEEKPSNEILCLLDGVCQGQKLFVFICNQIYRLSENVFGRPGRIYYHFRFEYPTMQEIQLYLEQHLNREAKQFEQDVLRLSLMINLNYDCLRGICEELNREYGFEETIKDLNIVGMRTISYDAIITMRDGIQYVCGGQYCDLLQNRDVFLRFENSQGDVMTAVVFSPFDCVWEPGAECLCVYGDKLRLVLGDKYDDLPARDEVVPEKLEIWKSSMGTGFVG